ncbi:RICIN domain-containing protein [Streptomyces olivochromogenes]|uniref:RICIN domain-containing protein n=1 Tax=Streptomyces olivochromogenes TaxID=1963 RepID=UPI001F401004|nr:RICIN domain-containing protein [Streptomyces olivochromogenes]
MQPPTPPHPPYPPHPGATPGDSDRELVARLAGPGEGRHCAVALLLARHWRATCDYAVVCLASATDAVHYVAAAAFHRVLGRAAAGAVVGALRPQLLVAVRETVREWAADDVVRIVLPELGKPTGGRGLRAVPPGVPERRHLTERAFSALPGTSQCLLWHTEVEAEPISIPAGLSGVDATTAAAELEQAREQFRAGLVRAHRELAPSRECRFYNRLLDVPIRRGGTLLPDVRRHLTRCRYCRHAAEQLGHVDGGLDALLAETVLGWGARRYLDSRPGRGAAVQWPPVHEPAAPPSGGRHRTAPEGRRRTMVAFAVGLTSLVLLATVLAARSWSDDHGDGGPHVAWGAPAGASARPGTADASSSAGFPSTVDAEGEPVEVAHGRLRSLTTGLCLDVEGGRAEEGVRAVAVACSSAESSGRVSSGSSSDSSSGSSSRSSSAGSQQWKYESDGRLRSAADPTLCLAADPESRTVVLSGCLVHPGEVAYDLTARGELLLRWRDGLAVAPGSGAARGQVVVADRNGSERQRWALDAGSGPAERGAVPGEGEGRGASPAPIERPTRKPSGRETPREESGQSEPRRYDTRVAQVGFDNGAAWRPAATDVVRALPASVDEVTSLPARAVGGLPSRVAATVPFYGEG